MPARRLALGTAQFGLAYGVTNQTGQVPADEIGAILREAATVGVETLDTAIAYGDAETRLGAHVLTPFKVVTKLPPYDGSAEPYAWVRTHLRASTERLHVTPSAVLLHRALDLCGPAGPQLALALQAAHAEGLVGGIGVSVYGPDDLDAVVGLLSWTHVQLPFNVVERRMLTSGWLMRLADEGVEIHARSAFLQGLLLQPSAALPDQFAQWRSRWDDWHHWCGEQGLTPLSACLGHVASVAQIARIVVGVDTLAHFRDITSGMPTTPVAAPMSFASTDRRLIDPTQWAKRA